MAHLMDKGDLRHQTPLRTFLWIALKFFLVGDFMIMLAKYHVDVIYKEVPYFAGQPPNHSLKELFLRYLKTHAVFRLGVTGLATSILHGMTASAYNEALAKRTKPLRVFPLLVKFLVARVVFDLAFWGGHRLLHTPFLYKRLHRTHHEDVEPSVLGTNINFNVIDLLIEASVPIGLGIASVGGPARIGVSLLEEVIISQYLTWFLTCSHAGKALPTSSVFAPLSFWNHWAPWLSDTVSHHHNHHRVFKANYGISSWPDRLFGTCQPMSPTSHTQSSAGSSQPPCSSRTAGDDVGSGDVSVAAVASKPCA